VKLPILYPILDTAMLAARNCPLEPAAAALLDSGAGILQIRHKGHWSRHIFEQSRRIAERCARAGVPLIVNDRADIAMLLGAGLHVGQDDLPPAEARRLIGPDATLGFSTHNADQLAAAVREPVTYVALGPMFPTRSKENPDPVAGPERLREWRGLTKLPLVAIGGIARDNARAVLDAGADSLAVIGDLFPDPCTSASIAERMREWRRTIGR
jgi:thiamine-phosphate pyrophosphorylase